jgi:hypothetical protein
MSPAGNWSQNLKNKSRNIIGAAYRVLTFLAVLLWNVLPWISILAPMA